MPTDTDETGQSVDSDADIYGVVTDDGVIDTGIVERPDLPKFHDMNKDIPQELPPILADAQYSYWIVGRTRSTQDACGYETWAPLEESSPAPDAGGGRLHINADETIANGHTNNNAYLEELFIVPRNQCVQTYQNGTERETLFTDNTCLEYRSTGSALSMHADGTTPARSQHMGIGYNHKWLHATDPSENPSLEIFVPMEDLTVEIARGCFLIEWEDNAILRARSNRPQDDLCSRQDGLFCKNMFTVPEEVVPDRSDSGENVVEDVECIAWHEYDVAMTRTQ